MPTKAKVLGHPRSIARPPRLSTTARGYGAAWQRLRLTILANEPLCRHCLTATPPTITPATDVDHIVSMSRGGTNDPANLCPLCKACHSVKSVNVDGGFGGRRA